MQLRSNLAPRAAPRSCPRGVLHLARPRLQPAQGLFDTKTEAPAKWWEAGKDVWVECKSAAQLKEEIAKSDKLVVVDWFATWCHGCEKSFPEVTKVASDPDLRKQFKFLKACIENMQAFARAEGITALPRVSVYKPGEGRLVTIDVPFSRVKHLRTNLKVILGNPNKSYVLDPNGFVTPIDKKQAAEDASSKAQAVEELQASTGGLHEHLMALANKKKGDAAATSAAPTPAPSTPQPPGGGVYGMLKTAAGGAASPAGPQQEQQEKVPWPASLNLGQMYALDKQIFLTRHGKEYGYGGKLDEIWFDEVGSRMKPGEHYLDFTGSSVYCRSQLTAVFNDLQTHLFGNPHSANPSSQLTSERIDDARLELLRFFNADPAEYTVVFTKSATGALKLVGETFPWSDKSLFRYLRENHNSVLGIREYAMQQGGHFEAVDERSVEEWLGGSSSPLEYVPLQTSAEKPAFSLFAFPGEDNFAGVKYPLGWIQALRAKSSPGHRWLSLVDAAAFCANNPLDLTQHPADFVDVAFYKMFGYPTGLGALLVRTEVVESLKKVFWGGGTVALATASDNFHVLKCKPSDKLENGTVDFLDIIALKHGLQLLQSLGGMERVRDHTQSLAQWTFDQLSRLKHSNGRPMLAIFGKHTDPQRDKVQGPIINFEVLATDGSVLSYKTFEREAAAAGFHVRTGTECNPGACYNYLGIQESEVEGLAGIKEGCEDEVEFMQVERPATGPKQVVSSAQHLPTIADKAFALGHPAEVALKWVQVPLGSVRISFGHMSTFEDCWAFVHFVSKTYADRPPAPTIAVTLAQA